MAWRVFYSYSPKDEIFREQLGTYLAPLKQQKKIVEWHDRKIQPGSNWESEISQQLESAQLILLLVSADFLASDYCFGVEVERALARLKLGSAKVVPILLKPCLWQESRFSELQMIPRDARPITSWTSLDEAMNDVAGEIRKLVSEVEPSPLTDNLHSPDRREFDASLNLVRIQVRSYANLYERTRQRMSPSHERTGMMEQVFKRMLNLAQASYPLLDELANSTSPGERLAAVSILQKFSGKQFLPFLVNMVRSEKPFVQYQAIQALYFAVGAINPHDYPQLSNALAEAKATLDSASISLDTDRQSVLRRAQEELQKTIELLIINQNAYE